MSVEDVQGRKEALRWARQDVNLSMGVVPLKMLNSVRLARHVSVTKRLYKPDYEKMIDLGS